MLIGCSVRRSFRESAQRLHAPHGDAGCGTKLTLSVIAVRVGREATEAMQAPSDIKKQNEKLREEITQLKQKLSLLENRPANASKDDRGTPSPSVKSCFICNCRLVSYWMV